MDRRAFLAAAGLVAAGATAAVGIDAAESSPLAATARTAMPAGRGKPDQVRVTFHAHPADRVIALTLDDGPTRAWTPRMLSMLADHDVRATFYLVGTRLQRAPQLARTTATRGHELGNHTWAHSDLTTHGQQFIAHSLQRTHELIRNVAGQQARTLRPPWGRIDSVGLAVCADLGYEVVLWSQHVTGGNPVADAATTLHAASAGSIILAHDGGTEPNKTLLRALDDLVGGLKDRGFRFATVSELLAARPDEVPSLRA